MKQQEKEIERSNEGKELQRQELIRAICFMVDKIKDMDVLKRCYNFIKYLYIHN